MKTNKKMALLPAAHRQNSRVVRVRRKMGGQGGNRSSMSQEQHGCEPTGEQKRSRVVLEIAGLRYDTMKRQVAGGHAAPSSRAPNSAQRISALWTVKKPVRGLLLGKSRPRAVGARQTGRVRAQQLMVDRAGAGRRRWGGSCHGGQVSRCRKVPNALQLSIIMSPMRRNVSFCGQRARGGSGSADASVDAAHATTRQGPRPHLQPPSHHALPKR